MFGRVLALTGLVAALALAGCGGGVHDRSLAPKTATQPPPDTTAAPTITIVPSLPSHVPLKGKGPAKGESTRVITGWLAALRAGRVAKASGYFGNPADVENGTPLMTLRTKKARIAFNAAFPCGAKATRMQGAAHGFTIVGFVLTTRHGADCQGAEGGLAAGAIRVSHGKIVEWYRLADPPQPVKPPHRISQNPANGLA